MVVRPACGKPADGRASLTCTKSSGCWYGNGRSTTELTTLKIAVFAPIPNARVSIVIAAKPGLLSRLLIPNRMSLNKFSISHHFPTLGFTCVAVQLCLVHSNIRDLHSMIAFPIPSISYQRSRLFLFQGERTDRQAPPLLLSPSPRRRREISNRAATHSYRSATRGSTFVARLPGT